MKDINPSKIEIKTLSKEVALENVRRLLEIERDYPEPWTQENFLVDMPEKWALSKYAELNNEIAGFLVASHKRGSFYIHRFMVNPNCRGKGIGKILHSDFEKSCVQRGDEDNISLRVLANNSPTIKLYESLGYEIIAKEEDVRYLMKKKI